MTAPILAIRGLTKHYGALTVTDNVNLALTQGECHALIGPNGAGKTTLVNLIAGTLRPDDGRITVANIDITHSPPHLRVAQGIARTFQVSNPFARLSVIENIVMAVRRRYARDRHACEEEAVRIANECGLGDRLGMVADLLSHGEKRQLELSIALATQPKLLLLDEPMAGIGIAESAVMLALLAKIRGRSTIVLVEHDMDTVFRLADRITVLVAGRIIATGLPAEIREDHEVRRAYLGDAMTRSPDR